MLYDCGSEWFDSYGAHRYYSIVVRSGGKMVRVGSFIVVVCLGLILLWYGRVVRSCWYICVIPFCLVIIRLWFGMVDSFSIVVFGEVVQYGFWYGYKDAR